MKIVLMLIYFGYGKYAQFDALKFDDMAQCEAARALVIQTYAPTWSGPRAGDIVCREATL